jgi:sugar phosphate permease
MSTPINRIAGPEGEPSPRSHPHRWRIFGLCWITYAALYVGRVNFAVALPAIQAQFGWGKAAVGLIGGALYWSYALGQLVNGALGDRASARALVGIGLFASALLNALFGLQGALAGMAVVWALNGWAQSTGWGPLVKTLSRWFDPQRRGMISALFGPCYVVGHAVSWVLAGWLVSRWGWRHAFWAPAVILAAFGVLWLLAMRDSPEETRAPLALWSGARQRKPLSLGELGHFVRSPQLRWGVVICLFSGMIKDSLTLWSPSYLVEVQGLPLSLAALSGAVIPLAGGVGALCSGWLLHRAPGRQESAIVSVMAVVIGLGTVALLVARQTPAPGLAVAILAVLALGSHGMNALLMTALPLSLGRTGRVSSAAGTLDFASYLGGGLSSALVGGLQDAWGWTAVYLWWLAVALVIIALTWAPSLWARYGASSR